jgi:hypothetical protein
LPEDIQARIYADLAQGYVVFMPKRALEVQGRRFHAWWRVDPAEGHTLGIGEQGRGQGTVTYGIALRVVVVPFIVDCAVNADTDWDILVCFIIGGMGLWEIPLLATKAQLIYGLIAAFVGYTSLDL